MPNLGPIFLVELPFYDRLPTSPYPFQLVGVGLPVALDEGEGGVQRSRSEAGGSIGDDSN